MPPPCHWPGGAGRALDTVLVWSGHTRAVRTRSNHGFLKTPQTDRRDEPRFREALFVHPNRWEWHQTPALSWWGRFRRDAPRVCLILRFMNIAGVSTR